MSFYFYAIFYCAHTVHCTVYSVGKAVFFYEITTYRILYTTVYAYKQV